VTLIEYGETNIQDFVLPDALPESEFFNFPVGAPTGEDFNFRFIFNQWNSVDSRNPKDRDRIGQLKVYRYHHFFNLTSWEWQSDLNEEALKHHTCTAEDIN
jgi:hypothetical protein